MIIKGPSIRVFTPVTEEGPSADAQQHENRLRAPKPEERASLYLQAVYGQHDFTNDEISKARNVILDAMAANIVDRSESRLSNEPAVPATRPQSESPYGIMSVRAARASHSPYRDPAPRDTPQLALSEEALEHHNSYEFASLRVEASASADVAIRPRYDSRRDALNVRPSGASQTRKLTNRRIAIFGAAAVAIAAELILIVTYPNPWVHENSNSVATLSSPLPESLAKEADSGASTREIAVAPSARSDQEPFSSVGARVNDEKGLIQLGQQLMAAGDVAGARSVLTRAFNAGNVPTTLGFGVADHPRDPAADALRASNALALGATYDPIILEKLGARDVSPDVAEARAWYQKARDLGSAEASARLKNLARRDDRAH
jgi:hypothetical protein